MKELIGHASNTYLAVNSSENKMLPMVELILLTSEPKYQADLSGFVKTRTVEDVRLSVSPESLRKLAKQFGDIADGAELLAERCHLEIPHEG